MKKYLYAFLPFTFLILFFYTDSYAQLHVGLRAGVNFANLKPEAVVPFKSKTSANFAVLLNRQLNRSFSIQLEPGFSQRGARYDISGEGLLNGIVLRSESVGKIHLNYIELPILLQYKPKIGRLEGILSLGPEVRLQLGAAKFSYTDKIYYGGVKSMDDSGKTNLGPNLNNFDYGFTGGLGIAYPFHAFKIFTEARYHLGLRKIYTDGIKIFNRGASVHLGILLPMPKHG